MVQCFAPATSVAKVCCGACELHVGAVQKVSIQGWGVFDYCQAAIAEDLYRGLFVEVLKGEKMKSLLELKLAAKVAEDAFEAATKLVEQAQALPENNVYPSLEDAEYKIEDMLADRAHEDCEGAGNCGDLEYRQLFMVGDKMYVGIYEVDYNRHDKTYYYVDGAEFRIEEVVDAVSN